MSDQCPFCKAALEDHQLEHMHRWRGRYVLVRGVPAQRCSQCREVFLAPDVLQELDRLAESPAELEMVEVPLLQFPSRRAA